MLFENLFDHSPRAGASLPPNQRQMLKIPSGLQILDRTSKLRVTNSGCANRNNFIGHELLEMNAWTPLMTSEKTESDMLLSYLLEHILRVGNNQMKSDRRMVSTKSGKNIWYKMGRTGRAGGKFQDSCHLPRPIKVA